MADTGGAMNESGAFVEDDTLSHASHELLESYIPVIVFLIVLAIVGISGNVSTAMFFGKKRKKTSNEMFITILAVVDLVVCVLIFIYVWQLIVNISVYTHKFWCKASYFVYHCGILLSVLMLCAIAIDRFKKVCRPFGNQFTSKIAFRISMALVVTSVLVSSRDFVTYDSFAVNVTIYDVTVEGRMCMNTRDEALFWVVTASHVIDAIVVSAIFILLVISYVAIVYSLYKHKKKMQEMLSCSTTNLEGRSRTESDPNSDKGQCQDSDVSPSTPRQNPNSKLRSQFSLAITHKIRNSERATTLMMLTVSVGLVVCFLPYFIATLIKQRGASVEYELSAWYRFAISSVLTNSVINPIVYCLFNQRFRLYLVRIPIRCVRGKSCNLAAAMTSDDDMHS